MTARVRGVTAAAHARGIDEERVRIHVDEHGARTAELHHVRRCGERVRGHDHLVARADPEREHGEMERRGAGRDRGGVRRAHGPAIARSNSSTFGPIVS